MMTRTLSALVLWSCLAPLATAQTTDYDAEIREIASRSEIRKAFELIVEMEPQTEKELIELTQIPAPPFKEEVRAKRYREMLLEAGLEVVEIDEIGNVVAERAGTEGSETVAVVAHLDTVFPEGTDVTVRREDDQLHAPGIGDDSRGLALVLTMVRAMNRAGVKTKSNVLIVGSVGEEGLGDLRGVKHLFREGGRALAPRVVVQQRWHLGIQKALLIVVASAGISE